MFVEQEGRLIDALVADVGKPRIEAYTTEIAFTINEIDHTLKHLDAWTKAAKVKVPLTFKPGTAHLHPEPLGTVCIIAPWNYPVQLLFAPLVPALAAGNTAVLKPSEVTPTVAALIDELVPMYFDANTVAVVTGAVEETTALLDQRFDHIFYTGNGKVGRVVMRAAAEHLTPVTLELGGKSPAIVAADANVKVAATRIAWAKFLNAGQTCVAPDYVLVEEGIEDQLVTALADAVTNFDGTDPRLVTGLCPDRQRTSPRSVDEAARRRRLRRHGDRWQRRPRQPVSRSDGARRCQARCGRDGRRDLRTDPASAHGRRRRRGDPVRQRPREAVGAVCVQPERRGARPRRREHLGRRRHAEPCRPAPRRRPICRSAGSERAVWAPITARRASTRSRTTSRCWTSPPAPIHR